MVHGWLDKFSSKKKTKNTYCTPVPLIKFFHKALPPNKFFYSIPPPNGCLPIYTPAENVDEKSIPPKNQYGQKTYTPKITH